MTSRPAGSRLRENRTRFVVLGMLRIGPMTGYALRQAIAASVGHFWQESYGQLYPTLRQLASEGLVEARPTRGGPGRGASTYHLSATGRRELSRWVATPPSPAPIRNELLLKVFFCGCVPAEVMARNLEQIEGRLRAELAQLEAIAARLDGQPFARSGLARSKRERGASEQPDAPCWKLTLDFGLMAVRGTLDWIGRAKTVVRARRRAAAEGAPTRAIRPAHPPRTRSRGPR
jgi:PadR family transcriptional regulator AphA